MPRKKKVELNEINDTNVNIIKNLDVETKKESNKEGTPIGKNMQNDKKPHPKRVSKS